MVFLIFFNNDNNNNKPLSDPWQHLPDPSFLDFGKSFILDAKKVG
jgi:hypothetical protein